MADHFRRNIAPVTGIVSLRCLTRMTRQKTIFPFYHVISNQKLPHLKHLYTCRNESQFEQDLDAMLKVYKPISIDDYLNEEPGSGDHPQIVFSFDDGLIECHRYIAPLLKKKGVPAIFFLNNDFIDNRGLFFRYKASLLIEYIGKDPLLLGRVAQFMNIPDSQVKKAILMITHQQRSILDSLSQELGFDEAAYLKDHAIYMSTDQARELVKWGFHLGAHSNDHSTLTEMEHNEITTKVRHSMSGLQEQFRVKPSCFAFPFTSDGIPEKVILQIFKEGIADVLFGTAGLKRTGIRNFIQRIPMELDNLSAKEVLKSEYLYYLIKAPFGRNRYFKGR